MVDGGLDCFSSKGSFKRLAKFVISNGVRERRDDLILFNCFVFKQVGVTNSASLQKPNPAAECTRLLLSGRWGDAFVDI